MKKLLSLTLVATLLLCILSSCNLVQTNTETLLAAVAPNATNPAESPEQPAPATGDTTLPEGAMILNCVKIIANGETAAEATAAAELQKYLEKRAVVINDEVGFPITLVLDEAVGDDSFIITASTVEGEGQGMTITGGNGRGVLYGVYNFLQEFAGFRAYTPDLEVFINDDDIVIWDGVLLEYHPVFEMRMNDWYR